jgi:hypothetical protein
MIHALHIKNGAIEFAIPRYKAKRKNVHAEPELSELLVLFAEATEAPSVSGLMASQSQNVVFFLTQPSSSHL